MSNPTELRYTKTHEWLRVDEATRTARVGITDHAQGQLGDVIFLELPMVGTVFDAEASFGVIESVKAASDLYAPVSGKVIAINEQLTSQPELVNSSPYEDGWLIQLGEINLDNTELLSAEEYEQLIG